MERFFKKNDCVCEYGDGEWIAICCDCGHVMSASIRDLPQFDMHGMLVSMPVLQDRVRKRIVSETTRHKKRHKTCGRTPVEKTFRTSEENRFVDDGPKGNGELYTVDPCDECYSTLDGSEELDRTFCEGCPHFKG